MTSQALHPQTFVSQHTGLHTSLQGTGHRAALRQSRGRCAQLSIVGIKQPAGEMRCSVAAQAVPRFNVSGQVVSEAVMGVSWGADHRGALPS